MLAAAALAASVASLPASGYAARISNPVAVFAGLDKITGRVTSFDVYLGETVQFGALQVTPRVCFSRDDTEAQRVDGFVEVDEITLDRKIRRIFTGWMFADSPGLNAVEHPIYDVWLTGCKLTSDVPRPADLKLPDPTPQPDPLEKKSDQAQQPAEQAPQPATEGQGAVAGQDNVPPDQQQAPTDGTATDGALPPESQQPLEEAPPQPREPVINGVVPKSPGLF